MSDDCPKLSYEELLESYTRRCNQLVEQINKNKSMWNDAIEAAAKIADEADEIAASDIRRLKR